jgi:hypothetical protein
MKMKIFNIQLFTVILSVSVFIACQKEKGDLVEIKTVDLENLSTGSSLFWNGSDGTGKFQSSGVTFDNNFNSGYGSWDGFVYSQKMDITTAGYGNQYSVYDGANGSNKFAIYYPPFGTDAFCSFSNGLEYTINSVRVCNSTYAALTMKNGDPNYFAKKFGGTSGNDKDWFKITAIGFNAAGDSVKSVDFYLADYRSDDNSKDYIINKWTTFDLSSLGKINKLTFRFTSTDNGDWGMNTPAYVSIDNLKYEIVTPR